MRGPIALFGAGGQLGRETLDLAKARGVEMIGFSRTQVDIADPYGVRVVLDIAAPGLIVNAAAYTAVDAAESHSKEAFLCNARGPQNLALAAAERGIPMLHFSTDYVFDGTKTTAYVESDPVAPCGVYGHSKAEGEAQVRSALAQHVILRTAWVYGAHGANFLKTMIRLAGERDELRIVADQRGCPTATIDLAEAIFAVDSRLSEGKEPWGLYHFAGTGATTWHGFAREIVAQAAPLLGRKPLVIPIRTDEYPTAARRPANSELDSTHFASVFGYRAAPWPERTRDIVRQLLSRS